MEAGMKVVEGTVLGIKNASKVEVHPVSYDIHEFSVGNFLVFRNS